MLLELYDIDRCLRASGIERRLLDKRIQTYPDGVALQVELDNSGQIHNLKFLEGDMLRGLRKFECSTGGMRESTPGFNVSPLLRVKEANSDLKQMVERIRRSPDKFKREQKQELVELLATQSDVNWDLSGKSKIQLCLGKAASSLHKELADDKDDRLYPIKELLRRSAQLTASILHERLTTFLLDRFLESSGNDASALLKCLVSLHGSGRNQSTSEAFPLILELGDWHDHGGYPANHPTVWDAVNQCLASAEKRGAASPTSSSSSIENASERVGLFGGSFCGSLQTMPERTVPRLGKVKIYSLSDVGCQYRYSLIGSEACPAEPDVQSSLASSLEWITDRDRENKTWADVTGVSGNPKQATMLIAYVEDDPSIPLTALAVSMDAIAEADPDSSGVIKEGEFEARTRPIIEALQARVAANPDLAFNILVIAKADPARTKLLYSRHFSAKRLIEGAKEWEAAARNFPPTRIGTFDENRKPRWVKPPTPYPSDVLFVLNTAWSAEARDPKKVSNARIGQGLTLLLESGKELDEIVREALRVLVQNAAPLVAALARADSEGRVLSVPKNYARIPLLIPSTLGLLLAKAGITKENYMSRNHYLIGRLLSAADDFHREYCEHERGGKMPPRLIGNALLSTCLEEPTQGLARLSERLPLYQSVVPREMREAAAEIERAIDKESLPSTSSDEEKAQMLLGYLARPNAMSDDLDHSGESSEETSS